MDTNTIRAHYRPLGKGRYSLGCIGFYWAEMGVENERKNKVQEDKKHYLTISAFIISGTATLSRGSIIGHWYRDFKLKSHKSA